MIRPADETIRAALACIPADLPRDEWARVAMALKSEYGDGGFEFFDGWSKGSEKYSAKATRDTWQSVKPGGGVTIGTLLHMAKSHGFQPDTVQTAPSPTAEELAARAKSRREADEREKRERAARQREAASEAAQLWNEASETGESPYLQRKRVSGHGVRYGAGGVLLVPMCDAAGALWNLQRILPVKPAGDGPDKLFLRGGLTQGLMHLCGDPAGAAVLLVAEGYATAATLHEATGYPTAATFTAGNLAYVVKALRGRCPGVRVLVCGDDDRDTEARTGRNAGREKATEAAKLVRGVPVFPEGLPEGGSDFNDLAVDAGPAAVQELIEKALQAARSSEGASTPGRSKKTAPAGGQSAERDDGNSASLDRFRIDNDGLWYAPPNDEEGRVRRICDPLRVVGMARDERGDGWCLVLEFKTLDKRTRRWLMPLAMLAGDGAEYRRELLSMGFIVPSDPHRRRWLTEYLQSSRPSELACLVASTGWRRGAYVLPHETLGQSDDGVPLLFHSEAPVEDTFKQRGTLKQWNERIGRLCIGNPRLMFAAMCAFAGPLLYWSGLPDGGVIHLVGDSSTGKTTALRVGGSVFGGREYLQRWRATDNGIEAQAAQHSDALLVLDELAQLDPKVAGESAYMLANGQGKARANRSGSARPRATWRVIVLSAGEVGLADHMAEANKRRTAGQELRMIDLPADAGAGRGLFEELHGFEGAGALALHLSRACEGTYGTPGRAWLEHLVQRTEGLSRTLCDRMDAIAAQLVPEAAAGQVQRAGRRFALIAAAGEMAIEAGIVGWPQGEPVASARRCLNVWIESRAGGIGISEDAQMMRQARQWFGLHGEARFTDWSRADDAHAPKTMNRAGWRKPVKTSSGLDELTGWEWYVLIDAFRAEVCKGFNYKAMQRLLAEREHLVPAHGKHYAHSASPPGAARCQVYRVKSSILAEPDE